VNIPVLSFCLFESVDFHAEKLHNQRRDFPERIAGRLPTAGVAMFASGPTA